MSEYKVPFTTILAINEHSNAERLSLATVYGFQVIVQKGKYQVGDKVIYIPIDSILPEKLENMLFPADSKVKLHNHRVRQIRLRGLASQGMLISPEEVEHIVSLKRIALESDLAAVLGVAKYEPPPPPQTSVGAIKKGRRRMPNPHFHQYNGLDNIKWFPEMFKDGEHVVVQEKLHGTNARASVLPYVANTLWKKLKLLLRLAPAHENLYGSNRVDISSAPSYKGFYGEDVYGSTFNKLEVFNRLQPGETVFGEIIGPKIQANYTYSLNETKFVLFDVKVLQADGTQIWLSPEQVEQFAKDRGFDFVPVLYSGPFNKELTVQLTRGPSVYDPKQKIREGIVVKAAEGYSLNGNKKALKSINEDYLADASNSDFH